MSSEDEYAIFFSTNGTHNAQNGKQIVGHKSFASCCFIPTQWLSPHKQVKESTCTPQNHRRRAQALQEEALGSLRAWWRHPIQSAAQAGDVAYMDSFFNIGPNKTPSNSPSIVSTPDVTPGDLMIRLHTRFGSRLSRLTRMGREEPGEPLFLIQNDRI